MRAEIADPFRPQIRESWLNLRLFCADRLLSARFVLAVMLCAAQIDARILDALMEHALKHRFKRRADFTDIAEGQRAFIQLTILHLAAHQLANQRRYLFLRRVGQGANSSQLRLSCRRPFYHLALQCL